MFALERSIIELRVELQRVQLRGNWGEEMTSVVQILRHSEVTWKDLFDLLPRPEVISDVAALALHLLLQRPRNKGAVIRNRLEWEAELRRLEIAENGRLNDWANQNTNLMDSWKRFCVAMKIENGN